MFKKIAIIALVSTLAAGCASVPLESAQITKVAKQFDPPSDGSAGLYIYRNTSLGGAHKIEVWVDGRCIGLTAPYVFFYEEVEGGESHKVSSKPQRFILMEDQTISLEASPNDVLIKAKSGMHYFIQQNINFWSFGVELVDEEQGKEVVSKLDMATKGTCGSGRNRNVGKDLYNMQSIGRSLCGLFC